MEYLRELTNKYLKWARITYIDFNIYLAINIAEENYLHDKYRNNHTQSLVKPTIIANEFDEFYVLF